MGMPKQIAFPILQAKTKKLVAQRITTLGKLCFGVVQEDSGPSFCQVTKDGTFIRRLLFLNTYPPNPGQANQSKGDTMLHVTFDIQKLLCSKDAVNINSIFDGTFRE